MSGLKFCVSSSSGGDSKQVTSRNHLKSKNPSVISQNKSLILKPQKSLADVKQSARNQLASKDGLSIKKLKIKTSQPVEPKPRG